jgi:hypothetical protein
VRPPTATPSTASRLDQAATTKLPPTEPTSNRGSVALLVQLRPGLVVTIVPTTTVATLHLAAPAAEPHHGLATATVAATTVTEAHTTLLKGPKMATAYPHPVPLLHGNSPLCPQLPQPMVPTLVMQLQGMATLLQRAWVPLLDWALLLHRLVLVLRLD